MEIKPSGWRLSPWLLQNLMQTLGKDDAFPKFLTGFQLGPGQLWSYMCCGILDALVQKTIGQCHETPQAHEEQSRNASYSSLCQHVFPIAPRPPVLAVLCAQVSYPEAAQTLLWTDHGCSLYREAKKCCPEPSAVQKAVPFLPLPHGYSET